MGGELLRSSLFAKIKRAAIPGRTFKLALCNHSVSHKKNPPAYRRVFRDTGNPGDQPALEAEAASDFLAAFLWLL